MPPQENVSTDPIIQIAESLKSASNVLITVSANPSVDQLAACIGLTLAVNKLDKHGTAVFSGRVPSTLEFLKPELTLERTTDSLRDFIISLDKSKADKLRYKVEDNIVKIFITPYRTSISDKDLEFTQGDFNVDAVIALGVHERSELDVAIMSHGRILHTATIVSINTDKKSELGSINWLDAKASSLCEMVADLVVRLDDKLIDAQIATALLTGMVAETNRFGNEKASPHTMSVSGALMAAGASPQLIASKLDEPEEPSSEIPQVVEGDAPAPKNDDGTIEIDHAGVPVPLVPEAQVDTVQEDEIHIDDQGKLHKVRDFRDHGAASEPKSTGSSSRMVLEPPSLGGQLTSNTISQSQQYSATSDPLSQAPGEKPILSRDAPVSEQPSSSQLAKVDDSQTLSEIEKNVNSPHAASEQEEIADIPPSNEDEHVPELNIDELSKDVQKLAEQADEEKPHPLESIGAVGELVPDHAPPEAPAADQGISEDKPLEPLNENNLPEGLAPPENSATTPPASDQQSSQDAPPPVPPPFPPSA